MTGRDDADQAIADLTAAVAKWTAARERMADAITATSGGGGGPSADPDPDQGGGRDYADPTGEAAIRSTQASDDLRRLDRKAAHVAKVADEIWRLIDAWSPRAASTLERAATSSTKADPGCTSCERLLSSPGQKRWEPIYRGTLCRWCHDWRRARGGIPPLTVLADHHDGKRVTVRA